MQLEHREINPLSLQSQTFQLSHIEQSWPTEQQQWPEDQSNEEEEDYRNSDWRQSTSITIKSNDIQSESIMHTNEQQQIEECPHNAHEQQYQIMKINWNTQNNNQPQHVQTEIYQINTSQALTSIHSANKQNASTNWQINSIALQNQHHQQNPQQNQHQQKQLQQQQQQQHQQEQQQQTNGQKIINCQSSGNSGRMQLEHEKLVSTQLQHLGNERSLQICQSSGKLANEQYSLLPVSNQLQNLHSIAENPTYGCLSPSRDQHPCGNGGGMPLSGNNNNHSNNDNNKKKKKKHWQRVATPNSASLQRSADLLDNGQNDGITSSFTSYRMLEHVAAPAVAADCGRMAAAA
ncbi:hypothetical protein ACLKA6_002024 [Drosophila palustris]